MNFSLFAFELVSKEMGSTIILIAIAFLLGYGVWYMNPFRNHRQDDQDKD